MSEIINNNCMGQIIFIQLPEAPNNNQSINSYPSDLKEFNSAQSSSSTVGIKKKTSPSIYYKYLQYKLCARNHLGFLF